jgi:hypothetical protein
MGIRSILVLHGLLILITGCIIIPLASGFATGIPLDLTLALIGSTLLIEYGAVIAGTALTLPLSFSFLVVLSVGWGAIIAQFPLFDAFAKGEGRVFAFITRVKSRGDGCGEGVWYIRWGVLGLAPSTIVLGFYFTPAIAWLLGWRRDIALVMMLTGYTLATVITAGVTAGVVSLAFPNWPI